MKDKGFTLIELLVVIVIMGIVGTIVTVSFYKGIDKQHQKDCDAFVKELEDAGCVYADLKRKDVTCDRSSCAPLSVQTLLNQGLLSSEINACTGESVSEMNETVTVTWDSVSGEKSCTYNGVKTYAR